MNANYTINYLRKALFIAFALFALTWIGGRIFIADSGTVSADAPSPTVAADRAKLPNLSGDEAKEYLKEQGLYESLGEAMQASRYAIRPAAEAPGDEGSREYEAANPRQAFAARFGAGGVEVASKAENNKWRIRMNLESYGYGNAPVAVEPAGAAVQKDKTRIEIEHAAPGDPDSKIAEWYANTPDGLEQGWTLANKPAGGDGDSELRLVLAVDSDLRAKLAADNQAIDFVRGAADEPVARYDKLKSWDADGRELATRMELAGDRLAIVVADKAARYPVTIDPMFTQTKKLTASDAAAGDEFGDSVSISGDTAIVGALGNDDAGSDSGSAYIFERNTGGANVWGEVKKLTASNAAAFDRFGNSVSISGDTAIVGAYLNDDSEGARGSAYIFERNTGGANVWGEVKKLVASDAAEGDLFGDSVSISGDTAIVGAVGNDDAGSSSGSAYIFERNTNGANQWGEVKKLTASDAAQGDEFGDSVSISGDMAIVGAPFNDDAGGNSGSAYIFERNTNGANQWGEVKKLTASDAAAGDLFGWSVSISGDTAIVGAVLNDDAGTNSGSAYIFERNTGGANVWGEVKKLVASDAAAGDQFGLSVSISGDTAIVGANVNDDAGFGSGSAYIFERNTGGANVWGEVKKLVASDAAAGDFFGNSVSISGDTAIVGANVNDDAGSNSGSAYIFTTSEANIAPVANNDAYPTAEDTALNVAAPGVLGNDTDAENNPLTAMIVTNPANGMVTLTSDGSFDYTPNTDFNGTDSFTYKVNDGTLDSNTATVTITVTEVNDSPTATNDAKSTDEDTALTFSASDLTANDSTGPANESGQTLTVTMVISTPNTHGTISLAGGQITYTPDANYNGAASFDYTVCDNGTTGGAADPKCATGTVNVTVNPINDNPTANNDSATVAEDSGATVINVLANDSIAPDTGETLTVASITQPANGTVTLTGGVVRYTPNANFFGTDTFTYTISDGNGGTATATVTMTVTPVNDNPIANNDSATVAEDSGATVFNVLANDSDVDGDSLTVASITQPANGTATLTDGVVRYTPNANYFGADSFTYTVSDGNGGTSTATVSITVTPVNDAPTIAASSGISREQAAPASNSQIAVVSDVDNAANTLIVTVNNGSSATVNGVTVSNIAIDANGNVTADIAAASNATTAQFTLTVSDGSLSATANLTVNVVYRFTGFFAPISNTGLNKATAGSSIPVKFSLNGYKGPAVITSATSAQIPCPGSGDTTGDVIPTTTAGSSSLSYDAATDVYTYVWKTEKSWKNTCRRLTVTLTDGTTHTADFQFK